MGRPNNAVHGTVNMYVNHKCNCERCRKAWREYHNARERWKRWPAVRGNKVRRAHAKLQAALAVMEEMQALPESLPEPKPKDFIA